MPEGRHVFPFLTVRENLELGGFKVRNDAAKVRQRMDGVFAMFPRLRERSSQNAGTLSGGEQQMLALGRAMMSEPQLLCLDEPSLGLAPMVVQDIFQTIRAINAAGTSVLLVEQNARYALRDRKPRLRAADRLDHRERLLRRAQAQSARAGSLSRPHRGGCGVMTLAGTIFTRRQIRCRHRRRQRHRPRDRTRIRRSRRKSRLRRSGQSGRRGNGGGDRVGGDRGRLRREQ